MVNPWFKLYGGEYLSDPKIASLSTTERSCWITLLCLASIATKPGTVEYLTVDALLQKSGVVWDPYNPGEWEAAQGTLKKFERMNMITMSEDGVIVISNWKKRQETNLTDAERSKSYRDRKKLSHENVTGRVTIVTQEEIREEENRLDNTSAATPRGEYDQIIKENEKEQKQKADRSYLSVFELWGGYPSSWRTNRSQIQAAQNLLSEADIPKMRRALDFYEKSRNDPFCPSILSPWDLDTKWDKLLEYKKKHA